MNLKLEAIVIPVSDVDRAKKFCEELLGFRVDVNHRAATYQEALGFRHRGEASYRIVQSTAARFGMLSFKSSTQEKLARRLGVLA
jgi:catechol 2,3-dioxygenase-like lactoylglutathione lyase family enzyme